MSNLDIFNLDAESLVTQTKKEGSADLEFYKPYPEDGKDGVYKSLVRFIPNVVDPSKSKIHKYYVYLADPSTGKGLSVDCPSTVGKKSVLKDIFWKLKNSSSAADQELAKSFSRKEDYYSLIQIVQDKNRPEMEGKIMLFKFGKKINDMIEAQLKPEYGGAINPFDLFEGKLFSIHARKVGEWNNYDLCTFVGEKCPIVVDGKPREKNQDDMNAILEYLKTGPQNLGSFDYKDWDDETTNKVMSIIRNTVPDGRLVNDILSGAGMSSNASASKPASSPVQTSSQTNDFFNEASSTNVGSTPTKTQSSPAPASNNASSLDDLYADL
jgi:hypothetical protein